MGSYSILILYAHPPGPGHGRLLLEAAVAELRRRGIEYTVLDLYEQRFDPILPDLSLASSKGDLPVDVLESQRLLSSAKGLIIIHPVWWSGVPAILKGWFDRVLTAGFAYRYAPLPFPVLGVRARPLPLLAGKRAVVLPTMGTPWFLALFGRGSTAPRMVRETLSHCGIRSMSFPSYGCVGAPDARKDELAHRAQGAVRRLTRTLPSPDHKL